MNSLRVGLLVLLSLLLFSTSVYASSPPVERATRQATTVRVAAPAVRAGEATTITVTVRNGATALSNRRVVIQRISEGRWVTLGTRTTSGAGTATVAIRLGRSPANNVVRAVVSATRTQPAATSGRVRLALRPYRSRVALSGPHRVVDETSVRLAVRRTTDTGLAVPGPVRVDSFYRGKWHRHGQVWLDRRGAGTVTVRPRVDTRWRVVAPAQAWVGAGASGVHRLDNVPPAAPVRLPAGLPAPAIKLRPQPRAQGAGANPVVRQIPGRVWRSMVGRSWHSGCPVGRAGLRYITINYWAYDGYRRRGELVVASGAARQAVAAFSAMYRAKLPIRSMYRVDRFGWSKQLQGGNDYRSMRAGNTSAFNCRWVVNNPGVRSPHTYGRSIDVNTWENPYLSRSGWEPNSAWSRVSHPRIAWRSSSHPVVRIFADAGFSWTYGVSDSQHFDARTRSGRVLRIDGCVDVCH